MSTTSAAKQRGNPLGPTGLEVARNLKRLRTERGLTQGQLSERLYAMDRGIPVASIGKIEAGDRRVEVDDLMAFAIALEVSPLAMLMPDRRDPFDRVELSGEMHTFALQAWEWAVGAQHLDPAEQAEDAELQQRDFQRLARPGWLTVFTELPKRPDTRGSRE